ncbi:molybdate transport system ATP-binding protein [Micromonospora pattaloongensis]|uniref:Molybdate transport system ATP-binding protein n=1 Tax=Micromonospora pattaloongensis TaxID=405436 RepID=A0A1H3SQ47_9ACTN|nr:ABC transporter ATP-binding protein [Micromonospora pattaloongensis]SDZ40126.1 molybdate transport system ATP-binding protein [Micromonospora pattaloongensis]
MTAPDALLDAHLVVQRGPFRLDLALSAAAGEVVALLGPNGAGKTTALRALAGLLPLDGGYIELAGQRLDDPAARRFLPAERRATGVVFQDYLLFPHLSAVDNVAFGPRCRGARRRDARAQATAWLHRVGLAEHAHRRPAQLSGGQAQRVALARALAVRPELLLLDEPLAALDARTRLDTRAELHRHLAAHSGAALLVTHDPLDAMVLADRLVIVEEGRIAQQGDPAAVAARPRTEYVARLVGLNLYRGRGAGHAVVVADGFAPTLAEPLHGPAFVAFPPAAVALHPARPDGVAGTCWPATVDGIERHGDNVRVRLAGSVAALADVAPDVAAELRLHPGLPLWASVAPARVRAYPAS